VCAQGFLKLLKAIDYILTGNFDLTALIASVRYSLELSHFFPELIKLLTGWIIVHAGSPFKSYIGVCLKSTFMSMASASSRRREYVQYPLQKNDDYQRAM
jgi:hypothetical protein